MTAPPDIFLSYNREDQVIARRFAEGFERAGFKVWWDVTLRSGEDYDKVTEAALKSAKAVVVLWSKKSVDSRWVRAEATIAERNHTLVPVMIEACERPVMFELKHTADLTHWKGDAHDAAWLALLSDVRRFTDNTDPAPVVTTSLSSPSPRRKWILRLLSLDVALGVLLIVSIALGLLWRSDNSPDATTTGNTAAATAAVDVSLAVLPFANLSSDTEQSYFADGLTDELINTLANIKGLAVTGRTSSFYFKDSKLPLMEIAGQLGVRNILQGSVRKAGNELRITVQLTDVNTGRVGWSQNFENKLNDIFAVQDEITRQVSRVLSITLGAGDFNRPGMTRNVLAMDEYLRGLEALKTSTPSSLEDAIIRLEHALALDPQFARGWLGVADAYSRAAVFLSVDQSATLQVKRQQALVKAVALAPDMDELLATRRLELISNGQFTEAESQVLQALAKNPSDAYLNQSYSGFLVRVGRASEALPYAQKAKHIEPLASLPAMTLAVVFLNLNRLDDAGKALEDGVKLDGGNPDFRFFQSLAVMLKGDWKAAAALFGKLTVSRAFGEQLLAMLQAGKQQELEAALEHYVADKQSLPLQTRGLYLPIFAAIAGRSDLALQVLQEPEVVSNIDARLLPGLAFFTEVRKQSGFKQHMRRIGYLDYWRQSGKWPDYCKPVGTDDFECH